MTTAVQKKDEELTINLKCIIDVLMTGLYLIWHCCLYLHLRACQLCAFTRFEKNQGGGIYPPLWSVLIYNLMTEPYNCHTLLIRITTPLPLQTP